MLVLVLVMTIGTIIQSVGVSMKIFIISIFLMSFFFSCMPATYNYISSTSEEETEDLRKNRRARQSSSRQNQCEDSTRCENICDRTFEYTNEKIECYSRSLRDIGTIEDVFDKLKNPQSSNINGISGRDFDMFAEIGLRSWNQVIIGEYLNSERDEDDDDDNDDDDDEHGEDYEYDVEDAKKVLNWIFEEKSSIGISIADLSDSTDVLYNLFLQLEKMPSGGRVDLSSRLLLGEDDRKVIEGIKHFEDNTDLQSLLTEGDKKDSFLEHFHDMVSDICRNARVDNKSKDKSYKICLSWVYFSLGGLNLDCVGGKIRRDVGIGYYLLKGGYRQEPESGVCGNFVILRDFDNWGDYWD